MQDSWDNSFGTWKHNCTDEIKSLLLRLEKFLYFLSALLQKALSYIIVKTS